MSVSLISGNGHGQAGRSFIELIAALGVLAVLSVLSLPSVFELTNQVSLRSERQKLLQDIRMVRFKAISRRRPAYLCALDSNGLCEKREHWNQGWMGFVDNNRDSVFDPGDEQVLRSAGPKSGRSLDIILHARWKNIKFDGRGVLRRSGHFRVCDPQRDQIQSMKIIRMNTYGRLAVETDMLECN